MKLLLALAVAMLPVQAPARRDVRPAAGIYFVSQVKICSWPAGRPDESHCTDGRRIDFESPIDCYNAVRAGFRSLIPQFQRQGRHAALYGSCVREYDA